MVRRTVRILTAAATLAFVLLRASAAAAAGSSVARGSYAVCNVSRGPVGAVGAMLLGIAIIVMALRRHRR
jgi:hypothetical protein